MFGKSFFNRFFSSQDSEQLKLEKQLKEMTVNDVVREFNKSNKNIKMEKQTQMLEEEKIVSTNEAVEEEVQFDAIEADSEIVAVEIPEETEIEKSQEDVAEEPKQEVSEETEAPEETEEVVQEPKNEAEENEPSEAETVETEEQQEEPQEEEKVEEVAEEVGDEQPTEEVIKEPKNEVEVPIAEKIEVAVEELKVEAPENLVSSALVAEKSEQALSEQSIEVKETASMNSELLKQIEDLKALNAKQEIALAKAELSKTVEVDYAGLPGKTEEKTDLIYEVQNSALSENAKDFILKSLKSLSSQNMQDCQEVGVDSEKEIDPKEEQSKKIAEAMQMHGLTENQAFLYVRGERTLAKAKEASRRKQNRK